MFCPRCAQSQVADDVRFCSRCGFPLAGVAELLANGGAWPQYLLPSGAVQTTSPRRKGVRQGGKLILFGAFLVPLLAIMGSIIDLEELGLLGVIIVIGGIMRLLYALIFEEKHPAGAAAQPLAPQQFAPQQFHPAAHHSALPPRQSAPAPVSFRTRDTGELAGPPSVTENTTRLLDNQSDPRER
jgi:hypothetical protein